jgi:thioredoxin-dependent peroxiredoxin
MTKEKRRYFAIRMISLFRNKFILLGLQKQNKMAQITLGGNPINTVGTLPEVGTTAPTFSLISTDLKTVTLADYAGSRLVLNIFPSIDTGTCATSVRTFNAQASALSNTKVLCISRDLPFAQKRFCGAEGLENVINLSDFKTGSFGQDYGLTIEDGVLAGLHSRVVIVLDEKGTILYTEQVPEIANEPNYELALAAL